MTRALQWVLKSGNVSLPVSFFFKIILVLLGPSHVHKNFRAVLSILTKNQNYKKPARILNENILSLYINLRKINILTLLNFPIHKNGLSPFMQSFNFPQQCFAVFKVQVLRLFWIQCLAEHIWRTSEKQVFKRWRTLLFNMWSADQQHQHGNLLKNGDS